MNNNTHGLEVTHDTGTGITSEEDTPGPGTEVYQASGYTGQRVSCVPW